MENSVAPDEVACQELSELALHCLHRYLFWSARLKEQSSLIHVLNTLHAG